MPKGFVLEQRAFDSNGRPVKGPDGVAADRSGRVTIAAGGFTVVKTVRK